MAQIENFPGGPIQRKQQITSTVNTQKIGETKNGIKSKMTCIVTCCALVPPRTLKSAAHKLSDSGNLNSLSDIIYENN